jgi:hypothetical protein
MRAFVYDAPPLVLDPKCERPTRLKTGRWVSPPAETIVRADTPENLAL